MTPAADRPDEDRLVGAPDGVGAQRVGDGAGVSTPREHDEPARRLIEAVDQRGVGERSADDGVERRPDPGGLARQARRLVDDHQRGVGEHDADRPRGARQGLGYPLPPARRGVPTTVRHTP